MKIIVSIIRRSLAVILMAATLNLTACGYFMYPERVGQTGGRIDPAIVVLDAIGLFIGIIPGVVAFAVDISTGAIYLSPGQPSVIEKHRNRAAFIDANDQQHDAALISVPAGSAPVDSDAVARKLSQMLGKTVNGQDIQFYRPASNEKLALLDGQTVAL
ncbi:MAG: hypothetical protein R3208_17090 [Ketobacteraceae bacterium]|nr:hypothetical protein [Ketobacteraceae bacterium]